MDTINEFRKKIGQLNKHARLLYCEFLSRSRMRKNAPASYNMIDSKKELYNHELEIIAFNSIIVPERNGFIVEPHKWILSAGRIIREQKYLTDQKDKYGMLVLVSALAFSQFEGQQHFDTLHYRYNFMYNFFNEDINMKELFYDKFGINFSELQEMVIQIQLWSIMKEEFSFDKLIKKHFRDHNLSKISFLVRDVKQIIEENDQTSAHDDFLSFLDLNLLLKYPIVMLDGYYYCPYVPYIVYAITKSLMFRLTEGNSTLRSAIGKNVIEAYVEHVFRESEVTNCFNIISEFEYNRGSKSSDVIICSDKDILFTEVKFFNQGLKLRALDAKEMERVNNILAHAVVQVYKNIRSYREGLMVHKINNDLKTFGLVLTYDDYYFNKEGIYDASIKIINSEIDDTVKKEDITKMILIMPFGSIERILKDSEENIFTFFKRKISEPIGYLDLGFVPYVESKTNRMPSFKQYWENLFKMEESVYKKYWDITNEN